MADISLIVATNADEVTKDVDRLKNSVNNMGNSMAGAAKDTQTLSKAQQASGAVARTAGKRMSGTGMAIQQVGYQTGDFLVQIQSGTNAMVAFGQQATQLVGVLPMVASNLGLSMGAAIGLSAGLGILIPLVTAVGAYFMRAGGEAKSMEDAISDLEDAVSSYADAMESARNVTESARKEFGFTTGLLGSIIRDLETIARNKAFEALGTSIDTLRSEHISGFESDLENIADLLEMGGWFAELSDEAAQFDGALITLEDRANSLGVRLESALDLRQMLLDVSGGIDNMTDAQFAFYDDLLATIKQMEIMKAEQDNLGANQDALVEGAEAFLSIWQSIAGVVKETVDNMGGGQTLSDAQFQQMLYYQQFAETMGAAPDEPVKPPSSGTSGGGRSGTTVDPLLGQIEQLETFLATERELLLVEYETRQMTLEQSLEKEYLTRQQYADMTLELEGRKNKELRDIELRTQQQKVSIVAGGIQDVLNAAANGNERLLKAARVVGAAEALINTYRAASQTLADPTLPFYAKFGAAASILAAGFGMVSAIKSGSSSGSLTDGSASSSGADAAVPTQATATPQRVIIEGINRDSLISGEQLSNIFEALYKENEDRGFVFEVAT